MGLTTEAWTVTEDPALPQPAVTKWRFPEECQLAAHSELASLGDLFTFCLEVERDRGTEKKWEEGKKMGDRRGGDMRRRLGRAEGARPGILATGEGRRLASSGPAWAT